MSTEPRRTKRKLRRVPFETLLDDDDDDFLNDNDTDEDQGGKRKASKRVKTKTAQGSAPKIVRRGRASGKLSELVNMPLDVLFEIFSCLHPLDLLHLSRTTKALRAVLMNWSARTVWAQSFAQIEEMPKCPDYMTEPEYATLAFDVLCQSCYQSRISTVIWEWNRRLCRKCLASAEFNGFANRELLETIISCAPLETVSSLLPTYPASVKRHSTGTRVFKGDYLRLEHDILREKAAGNDVKSIIHRYIELKNNRREHAKLCRSWEAILAARKESQRDGARERRKRAIKEKLEDIGWGEDLEDSAYYAGVWKLPQVRVAKDLSDRAWTTIKPEIIAYLEKRKELLLAEEARDRQNARQRDISKIVTLYEHSRHPNELIPMVADIWPPTKIRDILLNWSHEEFHALKDGLLAQLPEMHEQFLAERQKILQDIIMPSGTLTIPDEANPPTVEAPPEDLSESAEIPQSTDLCELATSWFKCAKCSADLLEAKDVHRHSCFRKSLRVDGYEFHGLPSWDRELVRKSEVSEVVRTVVLACGEDPNVMTKDGMDKLQARFALFKEDCIEVICWRKLISLIACGHSVIDWRLLGDNEFPEYSDLRPESEYCWACLHCWKSDSHSYSSSRLSMTSLKDHLAKKHSIITPTEDDWYLDNLNVTHFMKAKAN